MKAFVIAFAGLSFLFIYFALATTPEMWKGAEFMLMLLGAAWVLSIVGIIFGGKEGYTVHSTAGISTRATWEAETGEYDQHD